MLEPLGDSMLRAGILLLVGVMLAGCQTTGGGDKAAQRAAHDECVAKYPKPRYVAQVKCMNAADEQFGGTPPYADLDTVRKLKRVELAERLEAGKITEAQVQLEFAQTMSSIIAEVNRRNNGARSVAAQESMAAAASKPVTCTRIGGVTNCF